jgi:hypothetical protein
MTTARSPAKWIRMMVRGRRTGGDAELPQSDAAAPLGANEGLPFTFGKNGSG